MTDFLDKIKKLFAQAEDESQPATHEVLVRTQAENDAFLQWKKSKRFARLMEGFKSRLEGRAADGADLPLEMFSGPKSRGFVLYYDEGLVTDIDMRHLLDYFKDQMLMVGYSIYMSDVKNQLNNGVVETIERHYLKPKFDYNEETGRIAQRFGNITIEYLRENNQPMSLRLLSNIYSGHKYTYARPFEELMEVLVDA